MPVIELLQFITNHPLNRNRKLDALFRFAKWQIGSRLIPGETVFDWVNGSKIFVRPGETGLTGNIYTGLHEFPDMGYLLHVLRGDDLFVDVGANVGSYTILACFAAGARGHAFEPVPTTYRRLVENIRLNHLENKVSSHNVGIGSKPGVIRFTSDMDTINHVLAEGEIHSHVVNVEVTTLDMVLKDELPALIKIDVEGYETPVLEGAEKVLSNPALHSVIMELNGSGNRYGYDESRIMEMMLDHGFKTYSYDPLLRKLISLNGKNQNSGNTLFIRNEALVMDRINTAPRFTVHEKSL